jgi:hypothetical protein
MLALSVPLISLTIAALPSSVRAQTNYSGSSNTTLSVPYIDATGLVNTTGWNLRSSGNIAQACNWTWTVSVSAFEDPWNSSHYMIQQPVQRNTSLQDLESPNSGVSVCVFFLQCRPESLQGNELDNSGDCSSPFSQQCVTAIRQAAELATTISITDTTGNICSSWLSVFSSAVPTACQEAAGQYWPYIYTQCRLHHKPIALSAYVNNR